MLSCQRKQYRRKQSGFVSASALVQSAFSINNVPSCLLGSIPTSDMNDSSSFRNLNNPLDLLKFIANDWIVLIHEIFIFQKIHFLRPLHIGKCWSFLWLFSSVFFWLENFRFNPDLYFFYQLESPESLQCISTAPPLRPWKFQHFSIIITYFDQTH